MASMLKFGMSKVFWHIDVVFIRGTHFKPRLGDSPRNTDDDIFA